MKEKRTLWHHREALCCLLILGALTVSSPADEEGDGVAVDPVVGMEGEGEFAGPLAPVGPNGVGADAGVGAADNADGRVVFDAELAQLGADLSDRGLAIPEAAFDIFPAEVKVDIQGLIKQLLPVMDSQDPSALDEFFDKEGARIATVFDQLGLAPSADSLLDMPAAAPSSSAIKFPNEFENYEAYLDSLELEDFERDYMLTSRQIAESYEATMETALGDRARVQSALETYQTQLESLNERYAEQFRELALESTERAGEDGRRPDIDR